MNKSLILIFPELVAAM